MEGNKLTNTYKVCVVDVDGTLVDNNHQIPLANVIAIKKMRERGIPLILMTARSLFDLRTITRTLNLENELAITEGGGRIRYLGDNQAIVREAYLTSEVLKQLFEIGEEFKVSPVVYVKDKTFTEDTDNPYLEIFENSMRTTVQLSEDLSRTVRGHKIAKVLFLSEPEKIVNIEKKINSKTQGCAYTSRSLPFALDISATTKKEALIYVLDKLQIASKDCVVIGDSFGDLEAIEHAGLGVAMGNSPREVKMAADFVTASNDEGGVAEVIRSIFLQEESE